ncbi:hypothetical protein Aasi_0608 [Candidatus Amoebophilus asiaticus 5a2]|uniref:ATPase AAA-type core domain-containing protein n=1 Tax=Amoebophilus asiaticus (strain 5a2) TaxID=452471 RepID=B3ES07_AMOA5|nr:AAA family ATPase [Candidatus Amoebophilus asiaticus]ACE06009.1 hypothetical protein Aasi_0608 [Candidatus Amoebophilus asiaticus 5a2]
MPLLSEQTQQRRIHLQLAREKQPAKVVIYQGAGLMGGMQEEENDERMGQEYTKESKDNTKEEIKHLDSAPANREEEDLLKNTDYSNLPIPTKDISADNLPIFQEPLNTVQCLQGSYTIDGKVFRRQNVSGNGMDCFFNAAGLKREEQIAKLKQYKNDTTVRDMITNEIISAAKSSYELPAEVKKLINYTLYESQIEPINRLKEERNKQLTDQSKKSEEQDIKKLPPVLQNIDRQEEEILAALRQRASTVEVYMAFVENHIGNREMIVALHDVQGDNPTNQEANFTSIDAIAYINNLGIKIYQPDNRILHLTHQFTPQNATKIVYLYHSGIHFQTLIPGRNQEKAVELKPEEESTKEDLETFQPELEEVDLGQSISSCLEAQTIPDEHMEGFEVQGNMEKRWSPIHQEPEWSTYAKVIQTSGVDNSESEYSSSEEKEQMFQSLKENHPGLGYIDDKHNPYNRKGAKRAEKIQRRLEREAVLRHQLQEYEMNGITVKKCQGSRKITKIEFLKGIAQQVAPHLVELGTWEDIPEFVVITGKNGAGKSQLFEYIESVLNTHNPTINFLFRGPDYNNSHVAHNFDTNRDTDYFIKNSTQRKDLIADIIKYYRSGEISLRWQSWNLYRDILGKIDEGSLHQFPKKKDDNLPHSIAARLDEFNTDKQKLREQEIGKLIDSHKDYNSESHNVKDPLQALGKIFNLYEQRIEALLEHYRQFEYLNTLFEFRCKKKQKQKESVDSYRDFLRYIQDEESINKLIKKYIKEELRIVSPCEEANRILVREEYNFPYKLVFTSTDGHKKIKLERKAVKGDIRVPSSSLSSGEKMLLDLMAWLFYFQGVSAEGEDPAQVQKVDIMLLDEPDRHLDPDLCKMLYTFLHDEFVKKRHIQVFITTHRLDTVISAPKNSIYIMGERSLKQDKNTAVSKMTSTVIERATSSRSAASALSGGGLTVIRDENYVLVENKPDVKFYNIIYQKFLASSQLGNCMTKLIFMPVGIKFKKFTRKAGKLQSCFGTMMEMLKGSSTEHSNEFTELMKTSEDLITELKGMAHQGGGCSQVMKKVNEITLYEGKYDEKGRVLPGGNLQELEDKHYPEVIWGLIDNDDAVRKGESRGVGGVHAIDQVYSFENYICMPLNLFYYIKDYQHYEEGLSSGATLKTMLDNFNEEATTQEDLQRISDSVITYLVEVNNNKEKPIEFLSPFELNSENQVPVLLINGNTITYPKAFISDRGHTLLGNISSIIFGKRDEERMRTLLFKSLERIPVKFLPSKLLEPIQHLQSSVKVNKPTAGTQGSNNKSNKANNEKTLAAIIVWLNFKKELARIRTSKNSEEKIALSLPGVKKDDIIHFCIKQLQMKKIKIMSDGTICEEQEERIEEEGEKAKVQLGKKDKPVKGKKGNRTAAKKVDKEDKKG